MLPLPVPASVYGLVLLLAALTAGIVKLEQVKETLIPIQLGEAEPQPIFSPSVEEVNEYYEQQENLDLGM